MSREEEFNQVGVIYYLPQGYAYTEHIAAFDLAGTLIETVSGEPGITPGNWIWTSDEIPRFFRRLYEQGWTIVVFWDILRPGKYSFSGYASEIKRTIYEELGFQIPLFFAYEERSYKPHVTMYELFLKAGRIKPAPTSFYCGSSGGAQGISPLTRIGDADIRFAENIGLSFYFPDDIIPPQDFPPLQTQTGELVIFMGQPGSGKDEYTKRLQDAGYTLVEACHGYPLHAVERELKQGHRVVFNGTNPSVGSRKPFIDVGRQYKVPTRIFWFARPGRGLVLPNGYVVPERVYIRYSTSFQLPSLTENITAIFRIN